MTASPTFEKSVQEALMLMLKEQPEITLEELISKYFDSLIEKLEDKVTTHLVDVDNKTNQIIESANDIYLKTLDRNLKSQNLNNS